ncbi:MAG TPA: hypothetical protein PKC69_07560 [Chitinophagaceae bacterium]|nr:hypothetical protein [Chitinophagaceae bacterium]
MSRNYSPDQVLADRLMQDDTVAFEELYRRYWHSLFSYSYNKLHNVDDARKIVRTIFIDLWEGRKSIPATFSLSNHLYTQVRTAVVKALEEKLLAISAEESCTDEILEEFTATALQKAKEPQVKKYEPIRHSEIRRQQTIYNTDKEQAGIYMHVKWLFQALNNKIYS